MTSNLDNPSSSGDRARTRAYFRDFWPGIIAYGLVLTAVLIWGGLDGDSPWRLLWAVLPVVPALWIIRAVVRHVRRIDDYQRLLVLQGLGIGFAVAMLAALTVGFLGVAGLVVPGAGFLVMGVGMVGWAVSGTTRRSA